MCCTPFCKFSFVAYVPVKYSLFNVLKQKTNLVFAFYGDSNTVLKKMQYFCIICIVVIDIPKNEIIDIPKMEVLKGGIICDFNEG